jgi:hypothetical protein
MQCPEIGVMEYWSVGVLEGNPLNPNDKAQRQEAQARKQNYLITKARKVENTKERRLE